MTTDQTLSLSSQVFQNKGQSQSTANLITLMQPKSSLETFILTAIMNGEVVDVDIWSAQNPELNQADELTPNFLSELFSSKSHQYLIKYTGIQLKGINAPEININMYFNELHYPVYFEDCRFNSLMIQGVTTKALFQFESCKFKSATIRNLITEDDLLFVSCNANRIRLDNIRIHGDLILQEDRIDSFILLGGKIMGDFSLSRSIVDKVNILGTVFKSICNFYCTKVSSSLQVQRCMIEGTLFLRHAELSADADFSFTNIHNSFCMESLRFATEGNTFDLSGVEILGDLRFYQDLEEYTPHPWGNQKLILRNCTTKSFQDHPDIWPSEIDFTGFEYKQISGRNKRSSNKKSTINFADRPIGWILGLLARQKDFNPQPYWQLAKVMGQIGYEQKATRILYECSKERRKNNPSFFARNFKRFHFMINGYGYYNFRVLYWCILLIACGMGVLHYTGEAQRLNLNHGFLYSIDMLIPVVEFSKKYYTESYALQSYPAELYFFFHELMGYLFAFMVASGISKMSKEKY